MKSFAAASSQHTAQVLKDQSRKFRMMIGQNNWYEKELQTGDPSLLQVVSLSLQSCVSPLSHGLVTCLVDVLLLQSVITSSTLGPTFRANPGCKCQSLCTGFTPELSNPPGHGIFRV